MSTEPTYEYSTKGAWADFVATFAGVMLVVAGGFQGLQGLAAIADDDDLYAAGSNYLYDFNLTAWGWLHLVIGVISVVVGVAIAIRQSWGQVAGLGVAGLSMLTNFAFLPHFPLWAATVIAFDILVIWALCTQLAHEH